MNRRSLLHNLLGWLVAIPFASKLFAKQVDALQWKHLAITTRDVEEGLGFDGAMVMILEDLTKAANHAIESARNTSEPLALIEFSWRRIRQKRGEHLFSRMIAVRGDVRLGSLNKMPNGMVKLDRLEDCDADG